jgi:hypothetical protein
MEKPKSLPHSIAGMSRWANVDPEERVRRMTALSEKAKAKRAEERALREAEGTAKPQRRTRSEDALPPIEDLLPLMQSIQAERAAAGLAALSVDSLVREAALHLRKAIAQATYQALKADR